jgi:hypothetical protein
VLSTLLVGIGALIGARLRGSGYGE